MPCDLPSFSANRSHSDYAKGMDSALALLVLGLLVGAPTEMMWTYTCVAFGYGLRNLNLHVLACPWSTRCFRFARGM